MLNFEIDPSRLQPWLPRGTELDAWNGHSFLSVVGFRFLDTRVLGLGFPFHRDFEEVNLRFYVRRRGPEGWRRGVVFVKEIVPRAAIALVARLLYNENYVALPMSHRIEASVTYAWRFGGRENRLSLLPASEPAAMAEGSEEEFIAEHYWGYSVQRDGGTVEYRVEHPRWRVARAAEASLDCDVAGLYGPAFADALSRRASSAFLAEGSAVTVHKGVRL
jgi:uncharacterized protein YqjF (DUF2071 family)